MTTMAFLGLQNYDTSKCEAVMWHALKGQKDTSDYGRRNSAVINKKQMETCNTFSAEIKNDCFKESTH